MKCRPIRDAFAPYYTFNNLCLRIAVDCPAIARLVLALADVRWPKLMAGG
jgi:hypothetical protein